MDVTAICMEPPMPGKDKLPGETVKLGVSPFWVIMTVLVPAKSLEMVIVALRASNVGFAAAVTVYVATPLATCPASVTQSAEMSQL